jgi:hypothetical protein
MLKIEEMPVSSKLCPKIILEGTRLTFKTDIAFALNEHPRIVGQLPEMIRRLRKMEKQLEELKAKSR